MKKGRRGRKNMTSKNIGSKEGKVWDGGRRGRKASRWLSGISSRPGWLPEYLFGAFHLHVWVWTIILKKYTFITHLKKKYWRDKTLSKLKGQEKQNTPNKTSMVLKLSNTNGPTIFSAPCFFNFYYQMYKMYSLAHKKPLEWKHMYAYTLYNDKKHLSPAVNQLVSDKGMWVGVREFESPMPEQHKEPISIGTGHGLLMQTIDIMDNDLEWHCYI